VTLPPEVVKQTLQAPSTTPRHGRHKHVRPHPTFDDQGSAQQHIIFTGTLATKHHDFEVLAGSEAPTLTGGFANWVEVERWQRTSLTVHTGYPPLKLTVPILFDCVVADGEETLGARIDHTVAISAASRKLEGDIQILEWMAGRGKLFAEDRHGNKTGGEDGVGQSPLVSVYSVSASGREHPLVPPNAQGIEWVVTDLTYDTNPRRNEAGYRVRQPVTVELKEYVGLGPLDKSPDGPAARHQRRHESPGHVVVRSTAAEATIRSIAARRLRIPHPTQAAIEIANYNDRHRKGWRYGRSPDKELPVGTTIWVPRALAQGLG